MVGVEELGSHESDLFFFFFVVEVRSDFWNLFSLRSLDDISMERERERFEGLNGI